MFPRLSLLGTSMKVKDKGSKVMGDQDPRQESVLTLIMPDRIVSRQEWAKPAKQGTWELGWGFSDFPVYQSLTPHMLSQVGTLLRA